VVLFDCDNQWIGVGSLIADILPGSAIWYNCRYDVNIICFWRFKKCWSI